MNLGPPLPRRPNSLRHRRTIRLNNRQQPQQMMLVLVEMLEENHFESRRLEPEVDLSPRQIIWVNA